MGIPGFQSWLRQRYPEAFRDLGPDDKFNNVYIDLQSTLHTVTRKARSRHGFHLLLHRRLDTLINTLGPSGRVVLAMDGPAPLAKLLEQRRRRRRESERSEHAEREAAAAADAGDSSGTHRHRARSRGNSSAASGVDRSSAPAPGSAVSPLFLTTGTLFMLEVHNSLVYYICQRLTDPAYRHLHFELSDSTVKGEGELKILSRLLHTAGSSGGDSAANDESHVVVGGDSDLLVMAIASGQRHVTLWDDTPKSGNRSGPRAHATAAFDRDRLEAIWRTQHLGPDATQADIAELGLNMALLAIICAGNDYLPGCNGVALQNKGRPGLWSLFLDMRQQEEWKGVSVVERTCAGCSGPSDSIEKGCDGGGVMEVTINRPALAALLRRFQDQRFLSPLDTGPFVKQDRVEGAWSFGMDNNSSGGSSGSGGNGAAVGGAGGPGAMLRPPAEPEEYLRGLEWVLSMYASGSVSDYRFAYPAAPPLLPVLIDTLENGNGSGYSSSGSVSAAETSGSESDGVSDGEEAVEGRPRRQKRASAQPLIPAACALALLPARGRKQAATPLRHLMDADSPVAEIYAVCAECQALAAQVRSVASQLDEVRGSLAALQGKLAGAGPDAEGAPTDAEGDLAAAADAFEAAQDKLKDLMRELSRSQQEHFREKHPFKPFPTEALEAAVAAVPSTRYPPRERRLARFGREMVFKSGDFPSATSSGEEAAEDEATPPLVKPEAPMPGWLRDAARFASAYPRLGSQEVVQGAAGAVVREVLPLHPYMQPPGGVGGRRRGRPGAPSAILMICQIRRYGSFGPASSLSSLGPRTMLYSGAGFWGRGLMSSGAPAVPASALPAPTHAHAAAAASSNRVVQAALRTCARVLPRLRLLW